MSKTCKFSRNNFRVVRDAIQILQIKDGKSNFEDSSYELVYSDEREIEIGLNKSIIEKILIIFQSLLTDPYNDEVSINSFCKLGNPISKTFKRLGLLPPNLKGLYHKIYEDYGSMDFRCFIISFLKLSDLILQTEISTESSLEILYHDISLFLKINR